MAFSCSTQGVARCSLLAPERDERHRGVQPVSNIAIMQIASIGEM